MFSSGLWALRNLSRRVPPGASQHGAEPELQNRWEAGNEGSSPQAAQGALR